MQSLSTFNAIACRILFKGYSLSERSLQEKGVHPVRTFSLQKYSIFPAIIWCFIFVRPDDLRAIIQAPSLLLFVCLISVIWNVQQFLTSFLANTTSTISVRTTLSYLILLPELLIIGAVFNHDIPNAYSIAAIIVLGFAFLLEPSQAKTNKRARFAMPLVFIILLVVTQASLDAINAALAREALKSISAEDFLGISTVMIMGICWVWTSFVPKRPKDTQILKKHTWLAAAIPIFWFIATIPETYASASLPIYTLFSIGAITFAIDAASDELQHRIRLSPRTMAFIALVFIGMGLSVLSL